MEENPEQCSSLTDTVANLTKTKLKKGYTCCVPGSFFFINFHKITH